jgi:hypothetical protein
MCIVMVRKIFSKESYTGAEFVKKIESGTFSISTPGLFFQVRWTFIWVDIDGLSDEAVFTIS